MKEENNVRYLIRKVGLLLTITGLFLHIISLPLLDHYNPQRGFIGSMRQMTVVLISGDIDPKKMANAYLVTGSIPDEWWDHYYSDRVSFKYRNGFIFFTMLIYAGIVLVVIGHRKPKFIPQNDDKKNP